MAYVALIYLAMASSYLLLCVASALLFFFFLVVRQRAKEKSTNLPPSPPKLPIIGNLHQFGLVPHRSLRLLSNKHGPLMLLYQCHIPTLVVSSADIAEQIMKTHDLVFANRPFSHAGKLLLYDCKDILFSPYGNYWKQLRKVCMLHLLSAKRVSSFQLLIEAEVGAMIELIISHTPSANIVDLRRVLHSLVNGIMSGMALGKKYGGESERELLEMMEEMGELLGAVSVGDYFPRLAWVDFVMGLDGRLKKVARSLNAFLDRIIEDHEMDGEDGEEATDFVDVLLRLEKDSETAGTQFSRDSLKAIILDMFAASEFIAMTLEWAMAELIKHPNVMAKAQEEARKVVGRKPKVEVEDLHQMHYLKCIIKETLRLHPSGPLLGPRESSTKAKIHGYNIPPKTRVIINAWAIARDPKSWESPEKFVPERFVDNPIDFKGNDFHFTPFGSGRRMCPGISLASHTMELVLTNFLCFFDWKLPDGGSLEDLDMSEIGGIIAPKRVPLHLIPVHHFSLND